MLVVAMGGLLLLPQVGRAERPVLKKTIQSLANGSRGMYLTVDDAGALGVVSESGIETSGTWWELDDSDFNVVRSYLVYRVRNRGNNDVNGRPLFSEPGGVLGFDTVESLDDSRFWIVSYAGLYNGYHAYFIQNTQMEFLTLDGGAITTSRPVSPGAYWHIRPGPTLPSDHIK